MYRFGDFEVDTAGYRVRRDGAPVHVEPRVFDLLRHLIEHRDRVVSKEELLDAVWGTRFVSEAALTTALRAARRAVGDTGSRQEIIRTAHGRGYQWIAPTVATGLDAPAVEADAGSPGHGDATDAAAGAAGDEASGDGAGEQELPTMVAAPARQAIRFCRAADGVRIAYATVGEGPVLLKAANWMSHLDLEWASPVWSHWLHGLARDRTLVRYDERGCGMSDWEVGDFTFDDWVRDLETVVDASGLDTFPLLGVSQGGAVALAYAVKHPERVTKLVLAGAYSRGRMVRAATDEERAEAALDLDLARVGWAREEASFMRVFASQFLPNGTHQEWAEFTDYQRKTTSPTNAVRFLEEFARIDVAALASEVRCPTLILHSRDDVRVPASQASELASLIPDSTLVMVDSASHLIGAEESAWPEFLGAIDDFLAV
ncbi:alpha/beta fold hydrolase [Demequina sp. NBRC 110052]|uniref:alpha/beta fold hydrolase n=1 Tax=Demequina sp. NBRC 110052 TaxID=1570341 RepID=UPI000A079975|nr:alpha/beta fold hydrolase [Demequina sp. NBRC 110052]